MSAKEKEQSNMAAYNKKCGAIVYSADEPNLDEGSNAKIINEKKIDRFT